MTLTDHDIAVLWIILRRDEAGANELLPDQQQWTVACKSLQARGYLKWNKGHPGDGLSWSRQLTDKGLVALFKQLDPSQRRSALLRHQ
jgi:hypothetical protein